MTERSAKSKKKRFNVMLHNEREEPYKCFLGQDNRNYLIAKHGDTFTIAMNDTKKKGEVLGVRLYIDGQEVNGIKTMKNQGHYYGFKMGGLRYKRFTFEIPPLDQRKKDSSNSNSQQDQFGVLRMEFFPTQLIKAKKKMKREIRYKQFDQVLGDPTWKFFERPLSIAEGRIFERRDYKEHEENKVREMEYIIDYEEMIDYCDIYYSDFSSMQIKGIVNIL
jgi:hypothetical protein